MHTFSKLILAATIAVPMFAVGSAARADSIVPQLQYPSAFWSDRDNVRSDAYAYYPDARGVYGARASVNFAPGYTAHCFYRSGARTFAQGCRY